MLSRIQRLLKYCYKDNAGDTLPEIDLQLFLISVKSLMPYEDNIGCMFDAVRYEKEIELFKYYKNGHDDTLEYYFDHNKPSEKEDTLLEFKIIPIIAANTDWETLLNEALKSACFFSVNKNTILNTILVSSAINEYLDNKDISDIDEITKERLINFSLKNFSFNNNIFISKNGLIEFEKERVKMLSAHELMTDDLKEKFKSLKFIYNEGKENTERKDYSEIINETVLSSFSSYLFKLRKGIINPEKLRISQNNVPEFAEFLKRSSFSHPLLGRCTVIKRGQKEIILRNKSGLIKVNI